MSWQIRKNIHDGSPELAISGWEQGIAPSPYVGLANIRGMNILTAEKQAAVEFASAACLQPPSGFTATAFTAESSDIFTVPSTSGWYLGMALTLDTVNGSTGATAGATAGLTFYVGDLTATTFKLYRNTQLTSVLNITSSATGTYTVPTFGTPSDQVSGKSNAYSGYQNYKTSIVMTDDGYVWYIPPRSVTGTGGTVAENTLQFLGNTGHSTSISPQVGIAIFGEYLLVFYFAAIDYLALTHITGSGNPSSRWVYGWESINTAILGHRALAGTDEVLYFCCDDAVGSIIVTAGETFDPTDSGTYTVNDRALALPSFEKATCLAQLGVTLLVGGVQNFVYPWNRIDTSFNYPLILPEYGVCCIVSTNSNAYIFAGQTGNIYITNGANINMFKKIPDFLTGVINPYFLWGWAMYWKNQLFFSFRAFSNASPSVIIDDFAGVWSIDLVTEAFRMTTSLSYGSYLGNVKVLLPMGNIRPTGEGILAGYINGATSGVDYTSASPYTNYEAVIDSDLIPVGTFLNPNTFSNIEFKLSRPMVSGEGVKISYRTNLTDSFTLIGENTDVGALSALFTMNFQNAQWAQFRINTKSTASSPTFTLLSEIILRN